MTTTETTESIPEVCLIDDLVRILKVSRATIDRRRRAGTFPIPELPAIDSRPRWAGASVRRFLDTHKTGRALVR